MRCHRPRTTILIVLVVVAGATLMAVVGARSLAGGASAAASPIVAELKAHRSRGQLDGEVPADPPGRLPGGSFAALGVADGEVPQDVTVFDDRYPAVTKLEPALLAALRSAATEAGGDGVEIDVNSGWRSESYQARLFVQAVAKYGSAAEAARWVARPGTSVHEAGGAVDVGPENAAQWLSDHGAELGLCQTYRNEPWHFELRPRAADHGCPAMYDDATQDPRMRR